MRRFSVTAAIRKPLFRADIVLAVKIAILTGIREASREREGKHTDMSNAETSAELTADDARKRQLAYVKALSHSTWVRRLRILLPIAAVLISLAFIAVSAVRAFLFENVKVEAAKIEDGQIVMEKPAISGLNADGVPYSMTAARALQSIVNPSILRLESIRAQMPLNDKITALVNAKTGIYDRKSEKLDMIDPFTLDLTNGLKANFYSARLDVKAGTLETDNPVRIRTGQASVVAKTMRIEDKGKDIIFGGGVSVTVNPAAIHKKGK